MTPKKSSIVNECQRVEICNVKPEELLDLVERHRQSQQQQQRVYFAVSGQEVKIGLARDPHRRVAAMRCARPDIKRGKDLIRDMKTKLDPAGIRP